MTSENPDAVVKALKQIDRLRWRALALSLVAVAVVLVALRFYMGTVQRTTGLSEPEKILWAHLGIMVFASAIMGAGIVCSFMATASHRIITALEVVSKARDGRA
jgi:hypothetical protein